MGKKKSGPVEKIGPATINNRRAGYEYEFLETFEAGIVLVGSEVKSLYKGRASIADAHCRVISGELWLINADIEPYSHASHFAHDRRRDRKLLMHRREIDNLRRKTEEKGLALICTKLYFNKGKAKALIALGRGKKHYDKRETIKERESARDLARELNRD